VRTMGTQRCPLGNDRADFATQTPRRWPRSSVAGHASSAERDSVGVGHRSAVARTAQQAPAVPDLPSPFPAVGARGQGSCGDEENSGWRRFSRRLLHGAKKGGLAVGPTKRGKGTKILALADDHSLPLAVSVESASPHESQLVEGVLGHSFLDILPARAGRQQGLRQRQAGSPSGRNLRYRDDRPTSRRAPGTDTGWACLEALPQTLVSGTTVCLAASLLSAGDPLGISRRELLRHGAPGLHANPVQVFMRPKPILDS
jgi:hypothetical protein